MKILVSYRAIPQSPGWATGDIVVKTLRGLEHEVFPYAKYYQENRWIEDPASLPREYDLHIFMECNDGDKQYSELKMVRAAKTACWLFDTSYIADRYRSLVNYFAFNHIFLANPLTIQEYHSWGYDNVHYLPYACDPELHGRPLDFPKTRDVVLVGSVREDRIQLQKELAKHGVNMELIGGLFREAYIDALASAMIVVNQNPEVGHGLLNMRHWEAQAAGTIVFSEERDVLAQPIKDIGGYYSSVEDLAELCSYLLDDVEIWSHVTSLCRDEVLVKHTYTNRCQAILETVFS